MLYLLIGGFSALLNWAAFAILHDNGISVKPAAMVSFSLAAVINYLLCIILLFKHQAMWKKFTEWGVYLLVVIIVGSLDVFATHFLIRHGLTAGYAKMLASAMAFLFNFLGRKYFVFYEAPSSRWKPRRPSAP
ncbi:MAG: GtrA family protein [Pseudomonadota bacterium]